MGKVSYSAVVLDDASRTKLIQHMQSNIPDGWEVIAHHMTINMGELKPEFEKYLGMKVNLTVKTVGISDMALAVGVEGFETTNKIPHITVAVNRKEGGKPFMSNKITNWQPVQFALELSGVVEEVGYK
jgi:hypothetical protein